jgi:hypothetical protein
MFKLVLLLCVAFPFPSASAAPEHESVHQLDSYQGQIDFTTDVAALGGEEEVTTVEEPGASMGLLQGTPSVLLDRKLRRAGQAPIAVVVVQNSTGVVEQTLLSSASLYNSNKSTSGDTTPSAVTGFTTISCSCVTATRTTPTRLCLGPSASQQCSQYSSATLYYNFYASAGVRYSYYCWCSSSTQLLQRYAAGVIKWNNGSKQKNCPGVFKTTKSAFSSYCLFTVE